MENNSKLKTLNIPKSDSGKNKKPDLTKLIPFNIAGIKQVYLLPEQNRNNMILINDLETLNESSITNNFEGLSIKDSLRDSFSVVQSPISSNLDQKDIGKNNSNNNELLKDGLNKIEKENHLLKNEIKELNEKIESMKDKESLYEVKILHLKENNENLEKELISIKSDFNLQKKEFMEKMELLKNDIKNKEKILNSFHERIIYLNAIINEKNLKIKELSHKFKKSNNSRKSIDINITNNNNKNKLSILSSNKENENCNIVKNTKSNNRINFYIDSQKNMNLRQFLVKYKLTGKTKSTITQPKRENQSMSNLFQLSNMRHTTNHCDLTSRPQNQKYNINRNSNRNINKKFLKDISLKKQLNLSGKELFKMKHSISKTKTFENFENSIRNNTNLQNRNYVRQLTNISSFSYSNRVNEHTPSPENKIIKEKIYLNNNKNSIYERNQRDTFLKRLNKNNRNWNKTNFREKVNSNDILGLLESENNKKKFTNNDSLDNNSTNNCVKRKSIYSNINTGNNNDIYFAEFDNNIPNNNQRIEVFKNKYNEDFNQNGRAFSNKDNESIQTLLNTKKTLNNSNNSIKHKFKHKKYNLNLSNNINNNKNLDLSVNSFNLKESIKYNKNTFK